MTHTIVTSNLKNYSSLNFIEAAENGNLQAIKMWVEQGAAIRHELKKAFQLAAQSGHLEVVKYLIEHGAHPYIEDGGALINAAARGHLEVVKYLAERGANINATGDAALSMALWSNYIEVIKYLVDKGANFRPCIEKALTSAIAMGQLELVKLLIDKGANPNANEGAPIKEAVYYGRWEILEYLVDHGANPMMSQMKKVFVVMDIKSTFIGVYSCRQKAQQVVDRMGGEFEGNELIIEEHPLDDFSMFDPLMPEESLQETVCPDEGEIKLYEYTNDKKVVLESFSNLLDAEKALDAFKKNNPSRSGFIAGEVKGKFKINNEGCPISIMELRDL